jgi:hypothetical protein
MLSMDGSLYLDDGYSLTPNATKLVEVSHQTFLPCRIPANERYSSSTPMAA